MTPLSPADLLHTRIQRHVRSYSYAELVRMSSERAARTLLSRGDCVRVLHDRYVGAEHSESFAARAHAATRWMGQPSSIGGHAALFIWNVIENPPGNVQLIVPPHTQRRIPPWLTLRRASYDFLTAEWRGMEVVLPGFALIQAFVAEAPREPVDLIYQALRTNAVDPSSILLALDVMPRVRGRAIITRTLAAASQGAESFLEERALVKVFNTLEFATLIPQHTIAAAARRYRLDLFDEETRTAIELDGAAFHGTPDQRLRDIRRDADLATLGIATIRLSYRDVMERPEWCRTTVRAALRSRRRG